MGAYRMSGDYMFVEKAIEVAKALDPAFNQSPLPAAHVRSGWFDIRFRFLDKNLIIRTSNFEVPLLVGLLTKSPFKVLHQVIVTLTVVEFYPKLARSIWSTTTWRTLLMISTGLIEPLEFAMF